VKRVAIIMPAMADADPGWWREAIDSIVKQSYPLESMHLFQIVRHVPGAELAAPIIPNGMGTTVIPYPCEKDCPPTAMEQIAIGFDRAKDFDYIVTVGCNDTFAPSFIWGAVDALDNDNVSVAYSGYTIINGDESVDIPLWCDLEKRGFGDGNPIPDFSMFKPWVTKWFNPKKYGRASFYVMWTELFLAGGVGVFGYVPRIGYRYRHHGGVSTDTEYLDTFKKTAVAFLHEKGLLPPDQSLEMVHLSSVLAKHSMEVVEGAA